MNKNYREGGISKVFDRNSAEREARRFLRKGLDSRIRHSIDALGPDRLKGSTVLDVGCGVGALHQSLILAGARRIVGVDASLNNIILATCLFLSTVSHIGLTILYCIYMTMRNDLFILRLIL